MCYDGCKYFWYNPMTGDDGCSKPCNTPCVQDIEDCEYLEEEEEDYRTWDEKVDYFHNNEH